jgi:hypothetical protein
VGVLSKLVRVHGMLRFDLDDGVFLEDRVRLLMPVRRRRTHVSRGIFGELDLQEGRRGKKFL